MGEKRAVHGHLGKKKLLSPKLIAFFCPQTGFFSNNLAWQSRKLSREGWYLGTVKPKHAGALKFFLSLSVVDAWGIGTSVQCSSVQLSPYTRFDSQCRSSLAISRVKPRGVVQWTLAFRFVACVHGHSEFSLWVHCLWVEK